MANRFFSFILFPSPDSHFEKAIEEWNNLEDFKPLDFGDVVILRTSVFVLDIELYNGLCELERETEAEYFEEFFRMIAGDSVKTSYTPPSPRGDDSSGHRSSIFRAADNEGVLVYEYRYVSDCWGSGYSCSYSHGPFVEIGKGPGNGVAEIEKVLMDTRNAFGRGEFAWLLAEGFSFHQTKKIMDAAGPGQVRAAVAWAREVRSVLRVRAGSRDWSEGEDWRDFSFVILTGLENAGFTSRWRYEPLVRSMGLPMPTHRTNKGFCRTVRGGLVALSCFRAPKLSDR